MKTAEHSSKPTIAVSMIGHNEAHCLPQALDSAAWADELIYVDCESSDDSLLVAQRYTTRIYERPNDSNFNLNKSFGFAQAKSTWIFYLDPDERIPPALAHEIRRIVNEDPPEHGFRLPRRNYYFGRFLRHGKQYPDWQLRLFRKTSAHFACQHVHEKLIVQGRVGVLSEAMEHEAALNLPYSLRKTEYYAQYEAQRMLDAGLRPTPALALRYLLMRPVRRVLSRYVCKGGFLDGWEGLSQVMIGALDFPMRFLHFWWLSHRESLTHRESLAHKQNPHAGGESKTNGGT